MVVSNPDLICALSLGAALDNYDMAVQRAHDLGASRFYRETWKRAAQQSLDRYHALIDADRRMIRRDYVASPHWLDKASVTWRAKRKARS